MKTNTLFIFFLAISLSACENEEKQRAKIIPVQTGAFDPAMANAHTDNSAQPQGQPAISGAANKANPDRFTVDLEGDRVFLPDQGWISAQDFWPIYFDRPQELPSDIDFHLIEQLKQKTLINHE